MGAPMVSLLILRLRVEEDWVRFSPKGKRSAAGESDTGAKEAEDVAGTGTTLGA